LLCEGSSIRAVTRLTGASKNTVIKLMIDAGKVCAAYHDEHVRDLKTKRVQVDEIWSFTYAKQKNVATAKAAPDGAGDTWTWTAIDADSKFIASWFVGGRDSECAMWFMDDLARWLANRVQLTSDGHRAYLEAVEGAFGGDIDFAQLVKLYGAAPESAKGRYSPADCLARARCQLKATPIRSTSARAMQSAPI
jgi:IS1 family transposase